MSATDPDTPRLNHARRYLAGSFLLLVLMVLLSVWFAEKVRTDGAAAQTSMLNAEHLTDMLSTMRQAETGERGYLLTGNRSYLDTVYAVALRDLPGEMQTLQAAFANGPYAPQLAQLKTVVNAKLREISSSIVLYRQGNLPAALAVMQSNLNSHQITRLRDLVGVMEATQMSRMAERRAADDRNGWMLQLATAAAVLGTIFLGFFAIRENRLQTAQLRRAEAMLILANNALERKVEERTSTLRASEAQFRTLAESMPGFVFMIGYDGVLNYVSPQFGIFAGLTADELRDANWRHAIHPEDVEVIRAMWRDGMAAGVTFEFEFRCRRHDGAYRWILGHSGPFFSEAGVIAGWITTCTDIDDRKRAESALARANQTLERRVDERSREIDRIFQLSADVIAVQDFSGAFQTLSPAWERITGWTEADTKGTAAATLVHPEDVALVESMTRRLIAGQPAAAVVRQRKAGGGYAAISWHSVPLLAEEMIYSVGRDITADLERDERLRQSQKMEVVGQLTGGVAHDFNNLLTIIMGSLELLQRGLKDSDPKLLRRVEAAMDGAKRAAALTHRLLAFSRRQPLAPQPVDVNRLLTGMSDMLHRTLGEKVAIEMVTGTDLWPAMADGNQLENAVLNLAVNGRDAMAGGGRLTIETGNTRLDAAYAAQHDDVAAGDYVQISVSDTGAGMPPEVRAKIFEPFFTTKPLGQGTGLGLAQVYGFIKQSGGHVAVYSEPGHGTAVKLYLPRLPDTADVAPAPVAVAPEAAGGFETILLVEDEEGVRQFAAEILGELGYQVLVAENADAALAIAETTAPIDLLFTDVVLPGAMNGRLLAGEITRLHPAAVVVFTTGYTRNAIVHHGRLDDGLNFIGKPFTAVELGQTVRRLLDQAALGRLPAAV